MNFLFLGIVIFLTVYGFLWLMANVESKAFSTFFRFSTIGISILAIIVLFFVGRYLLSLPFFALILGALKKKVFNIFNIVYLFKLLSSAKKQGPSFYQKSQGSNSSGINKEEAFQVLGVKPGCNKDDIIKAHKDLIQSLHPDKSGNHYLASKINNARDILLKEYS
jgi:hypothetical protein